MFSENQILKYAYLYTLLIVTSPAKINHVSAKIADFVGHYDIISYQLLILMQKNLYYYCRI